MFGSVKAKNGKPILTVLDLRPHEKGFLLDDMQKVNSAYTKTGTHDKTAEENGMNFIRTSEILYLDKKRTTHLLSAIGFYMPITCNQSGYIGNISYAGQSVKLSGKPFFDVIVEQPSIDPIKMVEEAIKSASTTTNNSIRQNSATSQQQFSDRDSSYKTDTYYSKITPASRKDAEHLNMLDERNIARYRKEIDGVFDGSLPTGRDIIIGMPSNVLKEYGVSDRVIHMSQRIVRKIAYPLGYKIGNTIINRPTEQRVQGDMEGKHNLGISAVKNLPLQIADPIAITKNNEKNSNKNSIVIWTNWITEDGKGVMLGLVIDSKGATGLQNNVSTVFQADEEYAKRFFENEEDILYTKNKKDINQLLSVRRHMPKARVDDTFIKNVADKYPDVKWSDRETTSVYDVMGENEYLLNNPLKMVHCST